MDRPTWLDEEKELLKLLNNFIDRLDKFSNNSPIKLANVRITRTRFKKLFQHDSMSDQEWRRLQILANQFCLFTLTLKKNLNLYDPEFLNASIDFNMNAESLIRNWLDRPKLTPYSQQWHTAVKFYASQFDDGGECILDRPSVIKGKTAQEVVHAFVQLSTLIDKGYTLRQLSARCFWGASKFLDTRKDTLHSLFTAAKILPRPILVHIFLPRNTSGILFIENYDTYIHLISGNFKPAINHTLVYVSGMRGSAKRTHNKTEVSFHLHASSAFNEFEWFKNWWLSNSDELSAKPLYFWGDLDYSGLSILQKLRDRFGDVRAWQPGYSLLLNKIKNGFGHKALLASKEGQKAPAQTGCHYSDTILLPEMIKLKRFIDQESV